ncbi:LysR family transcriptional regulator [Paraburkholderia sp. BL10I2N1]|uniref:LysR family transcriptional regulator n=1 Tax=Paraburkholderia sp. BL10I2N1 TaxID=1938796 RepID=UPI001414E36E|nr:LysR family transcriptional regulator [Paraburkholderia sp. BL10I2N1]
MKVFDAILQTRSVTIAALNLGLTQSTVSNALNRLRDAMGDPLFVRTSEGMMPTTWAEEIADPIRESLARIDAALEHKLGFDPACAERSFTLFMTDVGQFVLLPRLLRFITQQAPSVRIFTEQLPPFRLREAALESGDVDLAVGYLHGFEGPFHQQRLFTETFVCVARCDHPWIARKLTLEQFLTAQHIIYRPPGSGHALMEASIDAVFQHHGVQRAAMARVAHCLGLWTLIAQGDYIAVLPRSLATAFGELAPLQILAPPVPLPSFEITQHWHSRFHHHPGNQWLRHLIASLFAAQRSEA